MTPRQQYTGSRRRGATTGFIMAATAVAAVGVAQAFLAPFNPPAQGGIGVQKASNIMHQQHQQKHSIRVRNNVQEKRKRVVHVLIWLAGQQASRESEVRVHQASMHDEFEPYVLALLVWSASQAIANVDSLMCVECSLLGCRTHQFVLCHVPTSSCPPYIRYNAFMRHYIGFNRPYGHISRPRTAVSLVVKIL